MTIENLQATTDAWIKQYGVRYFNELTNMTILVEEVGEVARLMSRIYGEQSFKSDEVAAQAPEKLADEIADVLFVLVCIANQTGINLTDAITKNFAKKTARDNTRHLNNNKLQ